MNKDYVQLDSKSGVVTVDFNSLEKMKLALMLFLDGPAFPTRFKEHREPMRAELKASTAWIHEGNAGIGLWRLESQDGFLTLVHYSPPTNAPSYLYLATLDRAALGWRVISFEQEREFGPI